MRFDGRCPALWDSMLASGEEMTFTGEPIHTAAGVKARARDGAAAVHLACFGTRIAPVLATLSKLTSKDLTIEQFNYTI